MALAVRRGWDPFNSLVRQMDRDFDNLIRRSFGGEAVRGFVPAANVTRDGTDVVLQLELPGIEPSNVDVEVSGGRLVISGKREESSEQEASGVLVREIRAGEFRREFALPEGVGAEQLEADYDKGMLTVRVHDVVRPAAEPKKIEVRSDS